MAGLRQEVTLLRRADYSRSSYELFARPYCRGAVAVGIAKEVYDRVTKKGTPEFADFLWTTAGAITWLILYYAVSGIVWAWIN